VAVTRTIPPCLFGRPTVLPGHAGGGGGVNYASVCKGMVLACAHPDSRRNAGRKAEQAEGSVEP
jgi:hypothetical protein